MIVLRNRVRARTQCPFSGGPDELAELRDRVERARADLAAVWKEAEDLGWDLPEAVGRG
ncbi:hypothetical protein [Actinomadura sp. KC06]|uniref:hypothetical protein n=1 Tax=Actinomadura sp. KC06 TaxID=2530369 RepID=UPI0014052A1E|nr:hypothetical protein [Actinomadura sp. KC06]